MHLEADLAVAIRWAEAEARPWAFSLSNAGAIYTEFRARADELDQLDWEAIAANDFRASEVKEHKQAEFLMHERFPLDLVERIGVHSDAIRARAAAALGTRKPLPLIEVRMDWYF